MELIGPHPVSTQTPYPSLSELKAYSGRIYMSYGDYNWYPPNIMCSYDPAVHRFRIEHSVRSDATDMMRAIDGILYVPHLDPCHYEDFADFSYLGPDGWRDSTPIGALHVYDFANASHGLYLCGSKTAHEGSSGGNMLARSVDTGRTWSVITTPLVGFARYFWCFEMNDRIYVANGSFDGTSFLSNALFSSYNILYKPTKLLDSAGSNLVITLSGRPNKLLTFDGTTIRDSGNSFICFTVYSNAIYAAVSNQVWRSVEIHATGITFAATGIDYTGTNTLFSIEVQDDIVYGGTKDGRLYAARLDGQPLGTGTAGLEDVLPDEVGRGLDLDGPFLFVGSPGSGAVGTNGIYRPLAGQATLYSEPQPNSLGWTPVTALQPTAPSLSSWFGKHVSVSDDLMAVIETGRDLSGQDRGTNSLIHLYQFVSTNWILRMTTNVPYAHQAAIAGSSLAVATANPAANQAAGVPGIALFALTRDTQGLFNAQFSGQLNPTSTNYGYKPSTRVATHSRFLVAGFAGDPSREGSPGTISIYDGGSLIQTINVPTPERFGYAVSCWSNWIAVGAPRCDTNGMQSGSVYVYRMTNAATLFQLHSRIDCPNSQPEAAFGSSVSLRSDLLLVGAPGVETNGVRDRGAVYIYRLQNGQWQPAGEMDPPNKHQSGFGMNVAVGEYFLAAASRFTSPGGTLTDRIRIQTNPSPWLEPAYYRWIATNGLISSLNQMTNDLFDRDGWANLQEYAFNMNPTVAESRTNRITNQMPPKGGPSFWQAQGETGTSTFVRYVMPAYDFRLRFWIETSSNLVHWMSLAGNSSVVTQGGAYKVMQLEIPEQIGATNGFMRYRIGY